MFEQLEKFREPRGLNDSCGNLSANLVEETQELLVAIWTNDEHEIVDALCDHVVFIVNGLEAMGHCAKSYVYLDRNTTYQPSTAASMILLRMSEYVNSKSIDALSAIAKTCLATIESMGYCSLGCMLETCEEINSRDGAHDPKAGKWKKFKTPEAMAKWYTADFAKHKRVVV